MARFTTLSRFTNHTRGTSEILGLVFAFGLVVSVIAIGQLAGAPAWTAGDEADHSSSVSADIASLDSAIFRGSGVDSGGRVAVDADVSYPERYLVVSPPGTVGSFHVDGTDTVTVTNVTATGPESVFWNGTDRTYATSSIVYKPDYAERDEATLVIESGVSYLEDNGSAVVHRQSLVRGTDVSLVFFEGDLNGHTTGSETVSLSPVSVRTETLPVYNEDDPIHISVPTLLSEDDWRDLMADEPHAQVVSYVPTGDHAIVTIALEAGVLYDVRVARLGVGDALDPDPGAYVIAESGEDVAVPAGGRETLVVRVFDRYGAPVAGATVTAPSTTPLGGTVAPLDGATALTDESGRARFTYTAPDSVTDIQHDTVTIDLDGASGPGSTVNVPLEIRGTGETYEVRNTALTPTSTPTATPTSTPTATPTATPTSTPTATPTSTPTTTPTPTPDDDFTIDDGEVIPSTDFSGDFQLLGSAIKSGNRDVPVKVTFVVGGTEYAPSEWDNVNDGSLRAFDATGTAGEGIVIVAEADGYVTANSAEDPQQVSVLRDGDPVPDVSGYDGQKDAEEFVAPYISDDGETMELADNQAIFLFELGSTNPNNSAFDMQDVVILVTLWEE